MLKLAWLLLVLLLIQFEVDASSNEQELFNFNCSQSGKYSPSSNYQYILFNLLGTFTSQASKTEFDNSTFVQGTDRVYGLYMCRGDIQGQNCSNCVTAAKDAILRNCPYQLEAIIWFEYCMVRYSPNYFFGEYDDGPFLGFYNTKNVTENQTEFVKSLTSIMSALADEITNSSSASMYGTRVVNVSKSNLTLYAMEQCTPDMNKSDCGRCLTMELQVLPFYSDGGHVLSPNCVIRYEIYPFFSSTIDHHEIASSAKRKRRMVMVPVPISVLALIVLVGICYLIGIFIRRKNNAATETSSSCEMDEVMTIESLQFDWNTIKGATNNFSEDRKLGKGGFGEVYKGILEDGQEVAVKRLSQNSGQGIIQFHTETVVVAKLQHNNLVKLLGFCLAPREKILIYEYLPNLSLDRFLSDTNERVPMAWETRFKIICGVARGLLYLHEDSRLRIIHRDLKPSNILLDKGMNPKIADFGLARLFEVDQTQGDTIKIAGSYGYMAPEYAMGGHFSVKSDVYSFGVIVLEIVSGQRNRFHGRSGLKEALLQRAWRLWDEGVPTSLIDTTLGSNYPKEEVLKCIQIGLLCIQDKATERPTMALVVSALNGQSINLPLPKAPTFFGDPITTNNDNIYSGTQGTTDLSPR